MGGETFDYVVVGSGSVVARRLVDAGATVALIEADRADENPAIHDPGRWPECRSRRTTGPGTPSPRRPASACKMGQDPDAVIDPELRVYGVEGLRVADVSIMPFITTGNTNAPTFMIGEQASDVLLAAQGEGSRPARWRDAI